MSYSDEHGLNIFYGAIINPQSLTSYDCLPRALIAVDAKGDIAWLVEDVDHSRIHQIIHTKLKDSQTHPGDVTFSLRELTDGEFILPGFVDTHTVRGLVQSTRLVLIGPSACPASPQYGKVRLIIIILLCQLG